MGQSFEAFQIVEKVGQVDYVRHSWKKTFHIKYYQLSTTET